VESCRNVPSCPIEKVQLELHAGHVYRVDKEPECLLMITMSDDDSYNTDLIGILMLAYALAALKRRLAIDHKPQVLDLSEARSNVAETKRLTSGQPL
jgi:hypothetical protein